MNKYDKELVKQLNEMMLFNRLNTLSDLLKNAVKESGGKSLDEISQISSKKLLKGLKKHRERIEKYERKKINKVNYNG